MNVRVIGLSTVLLLPGWQASAYVVHGRIKSCVVTIGNFCPVESLLGTLLGLGLVDAVLFGAGWLLRSLRRG